MMVFVRPWDTRHGLYVLAAVAFYVAGLGMAPAQAIPPTGAPIGCHPAADADHLLGNVSQVGFVHLDDAHPPSAAQIGAATGRLVMTPANVGAITIASDYSVAANPIAACGAARAIYNALLKVGDQDALIILRTSMLH